MESSSLKNRKPANLSITLPTPPPEGHLPTAISALQNSNDPLPQSESMSTTLINISQNKRKFCQANHNLYRTSSISSKHIKLKNKKSKNGNSKKYKRGTSNNPINKQNLFIVRKPRRPKGEVFSARISRKTTPRNIKNGRITLSNLAELP